MNFGVDAEPFHGRPVHDELVGASGHFGYFYCIASSHVPSQVSPRLQSSARISNSVRQPDDVGLAAGEQAHLPDGSVKTSQHVARNNRFFDIVGSPNVRIIKINSSNTVLGLLDELH
jgi:hypothetical protein